MGERVRIETLGYVVTGYVCGLCTASIMAASENGNWLPTIGLIIVASITTYRAFTYRRRANPDTERADE